MTVFLSGGCKNGKSSIAEDTTVRLAENGPLYYIATMIPHDLEDNNRIAKHIMNRSGKGFQTIERGVDLMELPGIWDPNGTYLLDSVTALLANEMFRPTGYFPEIYNKVIKDLNDLINSVKNIVFVSDFIFSSSEQYDSMTDAYLFGLSSCDKALAEKCDVVGEVSLSTITFYKGLLPLNSEEVQS